MAEGLLARLIMAGVWTVLCRQTAVATMALFTGAHGAHAQSVEAIRAAAEKEASLVWYAAMRSEHIEVIASQFRRDFPKIKLETIYLTSGEVAARVIMEQRGRRFNADIISGPSAAISALKLEKKLAVFRLPQEITSHHA
ncbi:MAG TPA: hypothetical protein VKB96_00725, partial [Gammaproteobacteria bacterium]|nr:hypothetical protein [Gammaproteobacteria bacterium]